VGYALDAEAGEYAPGAADYVDQAPGENHCEDEFDNPVGAGGSEGGVRAGDAGVFEDLILLV
jgi:hypothetical protein